MPPGGGGVGEGGDGGDHGHKEPASTHGDGGRDEDHPSRSSLLPPSSLLGLAVVPVESENKKGKHEQAEVFIPEGVLMEILSRVPYRSLCCLKCASRPWLALCSDHGVRKRLPQSLSGFFHFNHGWRFHNYLSREKGPPMVDPGLPFLRGTYGHFEVQQCSTSLLLCRKKKNMEGNVWREMKLPPAMTNIYVGPSFGQSQGCLYAWRMDDCQLSVWALENYDGGQWTLRCTVDCLELFGRDCRNEDEVYRMFAIHPECDMIFLTDRKEKTLSYNMNNKKVHVICASGDFPEGLPYTPCFEEWT